MYIQPTKFKYPPSPKVKATISIPKEKEKDISPQIDPTIFSIMKSFIEELDVVKKEAKKTLDDHIAQHANKMSLLDEKIEEAENELDRMKEIQKGEKGDMPVAGEDYPIPEDGISVDLEEVVEKMLPLVMKKMPEAIHGETPIKGVHYFDGEDGLPGGNGKNPEPEDVVSIIKNKKLLKPEHIEGFHQTVRALFEQMGGGRGYLHGGGDTIKAGSNITLTRNSDGTTTVTSSGGSGFTALSATETPNSSTTVFTFSSASAQPTYLVVDNVWMKATTAAGTVNWTWNNGTKKATLTVAANDDIWGVA